MSRFFSEKYSGLVPYAPGEQPADARYIKLNTNESPFPPSPRARERAAEAAGSLQLYSDPECRELAARAAEHFGVGEDEIIFTNGSDEVLNFAFMAFCGAERPAAFPDITYGFYRVFAELHGIPYTEVPLAEDFTVRAEDYIGINRTVFLANPNAPTGIALPLAAIEEVVKSNPGNVIIIDEAYVDFGGESAVPLIKKYGNLLVTQTFSKSRSLAGGRLGFGIGCRELIRDLNTLRYSTNPYNVNRMTMAAGLGSLEDDEYTRENCRRIAEYRAWTTRELEGLGFSVIGSSANFVFAKHPEAGGGEIYRRLREKGVLVRHFEGGRLSDYNRITIGDIEQMRAFIAALREITEELV